MFSSHSSKVMAATGFVSVALLLLGCGDSKGSASKSAVTSSSPTTTTVSAVTGGQNPGNGGGTTSGGLAGQLAANYWWFDPGASNIEGPFGRVLDLNFANGTQVIGSTACFMFNTEFTVSGDDGIQIKEPKPEDKSDAGLCTATMIEPEKAYLKALSEVNHVEITEAGQLVLSGDDIQLVFNVAGEGVEMPTE